MKNKCIWPVALLAVTGAGLWHFLEVQEGAVAVGDAWMRGWYLALLTAVLVFLAGAGLAFSGKSPASFSWIFRKKSKTEAGWRLEQIYPAAGLILGLLFLFVLPPLSAPDEISHYVSAYQLSSKILGMPSNAPNGRVLLRPQDVWVEDLDGVYEYEPDEAGNLKVVLESSEGSRKLGDPLDQSVYHLIWELAPDKQYEPGRAEALEGKMVGSMYPPVTTTPVAYGPQALGMALVRAMDWGTLPLLYLGRLCNLVFFVFMTWLAMKRLPFGKEVLFGTALLPMTLHLSSSFSYDAMIMGCMFYFTAVCLDLAYEKERAEWKDVAVLSLVMAAAGPCKMVYAVMMGLCLLIPVKKFGGWGRWFISAACVAGAWAGAMYLVNSQVIVSYATETESYVQWAGESGYSLSLLIHQPMRLIKIFYQTLLWQAQHYHLTMIGAYLGNLDPVLDVPYVLVVLFTLCLLGLALRKPGESLFITGGKRLWVLVVCAGCGAAVMLSMLIAWTPLSSRVINGVQGRYFLPFLPVLLLALKNDWVVLTKERNRSILYLMCCLNGYELLRLYAIVSIRL